MYVLSTPPPAGVVCVSTDDHADTNTTKYFQFSLKWLKYKKQRFLWSFWPAREGKLNGCFERYYILSESTSFAIQFTILIMNKQHGCLVSDTSRYL